MLTQRAILALMILVLASCDSPTEPVPSDPDKIPLPRKVAEEDYIELTGGLKYHDFKAGTGDSAANGDILSVHYHGWLTDSTLFDSSYLRDEPYFFRLGIGAVITGWDLGLPGMQVGGERQLIIPPGLAYGSQSRGPIPANSTLIFEVILVAID